MKASRIIPIVTLLFLYPFCPQAQEAKFPWPEGKKMAMSLSFDDARASNPTQGVPLLNEYGVKATFFVLPRHVENNLAGWKAAVASGHEMGNHSYQHPCSVNFPWSRERALENYTMDKMKEELLKANREIKALLGVEPQVYAYPCGQTFIGKGSHTQSFVPLISELFLAGRGWLDEPPVDPLTADMAQLTGIKADNLEFEELLPIIESAARNGQWLVLAGHETADSGDHHTTYLATLRKICEYAKDPANGIWIAPIGEIARYVKKTRESMADTVHLPQIVREQNGELVLNAQRGWGIGPEIKYMSEWQAFGWFGGQDQVEWDTEIDQTGRYEVVLEWSVSDEEAGKEFVLETSDSQLRGKAEKTGSWEIFRTVRVGYLQLEKGYHRIILKPATAFKTGALMDLKKVVLRRLEN